MSKSFLNLYLNSCWISRSKMSLRPLFIVWIFVALYLNLLLALMPLCLFKFIPKTSLRTETPLHCLNLSATLSKLSFCFRKPLQSPTGGLSLLATRSPPVLSNDKTYNHIYIYIYRPMKWMISFNANNLILMKHLYRSVSIKLSRWYLI